MTPPTPQQLTQDDLTSMSAQQIVEAQHAGQLNQLLGVPESAVPTEGQLERHHLKHMTPQQIVDAQDAGRLDTLLASED